MSDLHRVPADPRAIGLFDSGVGGLSIARALRALMPNEPQHYVADSIHCPYGPRGAEEIVRLSRGICRHLLDEGAKALVVACNTASAAALADLRTTFPQVPVIGMVPAVKPAAALTRSGVVGVLATPATFGGHLYCDVVTQHAHGVRVLSTVCEGLVERIEAGDLDGPETLALLGRCVQPLREAGADTLVLGCTHYPFVAPALARVWEGVTIVEPSEAIARQAKRVLEREGLLNGGSPMAAPDRYDTTGPIPPFEAAVARLLGRTSRARALQWRAGGLCRVD